MSSSFKFSSDEAMESMGSLVGNSSDEAQTLCDPCTIGEGVQKVSFFYCQECSEYLCGDCREFHKKVSMTRCHNVSKIEEPTSVRQPAAASRKRGQVGELSTHFSRVKVSEVTEKSIAGKTTGLLKPFTKASLVNQVNVSLEDDIKPCKIRSLVVVDNLIYVADYANGKIKLFDMKGKAIAQYVESTVCDITSLGKNRIAAVSISSHITIIDNIGNRLRHAKTIPIYSPAWGICFYNGLIYVSCFSVVEDHNVEPKIKVFTIEGELKQRIQPLLDGKSLFQKPYFISINQHTGTMYVSDYITGVIGISSTGKVVFAKKVFDNTKFFAVSTDDHGQVYVCNYLTGSIITLSDNGDDISKILKIRNPKAIAITGNQMYIGCEDSDIVRGFTLS